MTPFPALNNSLAINATGGGSWYGIYRGLEMRHCAQKSELSNYSRKPGFTETRLRPLARRRDITARPLLVFIRERNPCVLDRLRRLGWNVRFGIRNCAPHWRKVR